MNIIDSTSMFLISLMFSGPIAWYGFNLSVGAFYYKKHHKKQYFMGSPKVVIAVLVPAYLAILYFIYQFLEPQETFDKLLLLSFAFPLIIFLIFYSLGQFIAKRNPDSFSAFHENNDKTTYQVVWKNKNLGYYIQITTIIIAYLSVILTLIPALLS